MERMAVAEITPKSPLIPLLPKGELFSPLFGKEGKGRFFDPNAVAIIQRISDTPH
jgi:hypothetical protein